MAHSTEIGLLARYEAPRFPPWICLCLSPTLWLLANMARVQHVPDIGDSDSGPHDLGGRGSMQPFTDTSLLGHHLEPLVAVVPPTPHLQSPRKMWSCTLSQERAWAVEQRVVQQTTHSCWREAPELKPSHTFNRVLRNKRGGSNTGGLCH